MLGVAAYSVLLLISSVVTRQPLGLDVDISHFFMGLSMAGMFVAHWVFGARAMWELIFAALLVWFSVRSIQSLRRWGLHLSHFLIHAVMNFTMLLMYWFPMQATSGSTMGSTTMSMSLAGSRLDPGLASVLAFTLFASAIFTLASPNKGASHHGTHAQVRAVRGAAGSGAVANESGGSSSSAGAIESLVAAPQLEDASHAVMCVAMGFMLILML
jgi:hypothetical protein